MKQNKQTKTTFYARLLDNGVVVNHSDVVECEKFSKDGKFDDVAMKLLFGKLLWGDVYVAFDELLTNNVKITIAVEKEK